jgi:hypothetical protein
MEHSQPVEEQICPQGLVGLGVVLKGDFTGGWPSPGLTGNFTHKSCQWPDEKTHTANVGSQIQGVESGHSVRRENT